MIWQKVKQYKKWYIALVVIVLVGAGGAIYFNKTHVPPEIEPTTVIGRGNIKSVVSATGTIAAVNSVDVSSRVTGLITEVMVKENDMVSKGQLLLVLDSTAIRAQVAQYQAQLENYGAIYERSKQLAAVGGESRQQLDADRTNYLVAKSTADNYASQLGYYVITAPIDGMVIGIPTPAGQTVAQGISTPQVIMTIADMSKMQIKVLVDESDIGKIKVDQGVSFSVDSYTNKTFTGKVTKISRSATTSSNVVYYPVYVDVDAAENLLYPTMTARVTITIGEKNNRVVVPLGALKEEKGQKYVQVMVNGKAENTFVNLGLSDDENVEVLSGLQEGDTVVLPIPKARTVTTNQNSGPPPPI